MDLVLNGKEIFDNLELDENIEEKIKDAHTVLSDSNVSKVYKIKNQILKLSKKTDFKSLNENGDYGCINAVILEGLILQCLPKSEYFQEIVEMNKTNTDVYITSKFSKGLPLNQTSLTANEYTVILFQCLHALYSMDDYKFTHGNLIENNILVEEIKPTDIEYVIGNTTFKIPKCRFKIKLIDFEFSRMDLNDNTCIFNETMRKKYYSNSFFVEYNPEVDICKLLSNQKLSSKIKHSSGYKKLLAHTNYKGNMIVPPFNGVTYADVFNSNIFQNFKVNKIKIQHIPYPMYISLSDADSMIKNSSFDTFSDSKQYRLCYRYLTFKDDVSITFNFPIKLKNKIRSKYSSTGIDFISLEKIDIGKWLDKSNNFIININNEVICLNKLYFRQKNHLLLNEVVFDDSRVSYIETFNSTQYINLKSFGVDGIVKRSSLMSSFNSTNILDFTEDSYITCINREFLKFNPKCHVLSDNEYIGFKEEEHLALYNYTNKWNFVVNGYLRFNGTDSEYKREKDFITYHTRFGDSIDKSFENVKNAIELMDRTFLNTKVTTDNIILYRGVEDIKFITNMNLGYISTTKDRRQTESFSKGNYMIEYHLDIGIPYIELSHFSQYSSEQEFLLPRGLISNIIEIIGNKYIMSLSTQSSGQFSEVKQYNDYKVYTIKNYENDDKKEQNGTTMCTNNLRENGKIIDPIEMKAIYTENMISIGNTCYNRSTIEKLYDDHNLNQFKSKTSEEFLDPYTRKPISNDILQTFKIKSRTIFNKDELMTLQPYIEQLRFVFSVETLEPIRNFTKLKALFLPMLETEDLDPLSKLTSLNLLNIQDTDITDIDVISNLTNLETLILTGNLMYKLNPLSSLIKLKNIVMNNNSISSVNGISNLLSLKTIELKNNELMNVNEFKYLVNVERLILSSNNLTNIGGLLNLTSIKTLYLDGNNIIDISSLSNLTNIALLRLDNNNITSIDSLENMTNLTRVSLSSNYIDDINSLSKLTTLIDVAVDDNNIIDVEPLRNLTNVFKLVLDNNKIANIEPLKTLTELTFLNVFNNYINDCEPLSNLTNLNNLYINDNEISDISHLSSLTNLIELNVGANKIDDISAIENIVSLVHIDFETNDIVDIKPLKNLLNLETINLCGNKITDISPLKYLTLSTDINLSENNIEDISPLIILDELRILNLNTNRINELKPLKELTNLEQLNLSSNSITDLEPLRDLTYLYDLNLSMNKINILEPINDLVGLQYLDLSSNKIDNISDLSKLEDLINLNLKINDIYDVTILHKLKNLQILNININPVTNINSIIALYFLTELHIDKPNINGADYVLEQLKLTQKSQICNSEYIKK